MHLLFFKQLTMHFELCIFLICVYAGSGAMVKSVDKTLNTTTDDGLLCLGAPEVLFSQLRYTLYNQQFQQNGIILNPQTYTQVVPSLRTIIIIHGWLQDAERAWVTLMKDTYLNKENANVITLDWSIYSGINYLWAYCSVPAVGSFTGDLITDLIQTIGLNLSSVQINGFSLGAHVAGYAGQRVQQLNGGAKIERINGLDAAKEGYELMPTNLRLDASDANFVQGIHTNGLLYGLSLPYATVDFQVNFLIECGAVQLGCPLVPGIPSNGIPIPIVFCDHVRAIAYFIESILSDKFEGVSCSSCLLFGLGFCKSTKTTIMGENCPSSASGVKYLNTNFNAPFAKGLGGVF